MSRSNRRPIRLSSAALAVLLAGSGLTIFGGCGGERGGDGGASGTIKIGEYGSLTGTTATFGQSTKNGVEMAVEELKAAGWIGGKAIEVVVEDDRSEASEAATVVQKLVNQDLVVAVLGEVSSSRSLAGAPICQQNKVPMISPSSTNPEVTLKGDFIFRTCFIDPFQGTVMARFAHDTLGFNRVAILKDVRNEYSVGLAQFFTEEFTRLGGTIAVEQAYSEGDNDFRSQLTAIKARNPQAIFIPGYYTEVGSIARQAREVGLTQPLLGGDGWVSDQLLTIGGEALNGSFYTNHYASDSPDPALQAYIKKYREKYNATPDAIAGLAYDAARVLFDALRRLHASDPQAFEILDEKHASDRAGRQAAQTKLRDLIAQTQNFAGITGNITFDENRNPIKPAVVIKIEGGQEKFAASIAP